MISERIEANFLEVKNMSIHLERAFKVLAQGMKQTHIRAHHHEISRNWDLKHSINFQRGKKTCRSHTKDQKSERCLNFP